MDRLQSAPTDFSVAQDTRMGSRVHLQASVYAFSLFRLRTRASECMHLIQSTCTGFRVRVQDLEFSRKFQTAPTGFRVRSQASKGVHRFFRVLSLASKYLNRLHSVSTGFRVCAPGFRVHSQTSEYSHSLRFRVRS